MSQILSQLLKVVETLFCAQNDRNMQVYISTYNKVKLYWLPFSRKSRKTVFASRNLAKNLSRLLKVVETLLWAQNDRNRQVYISTYNKVKLYGLPFSHKSRKTVFTSRKFSEKSISTSVEGLVTSKGSMLMNLEIISIKRFH